MGEIERGVKRARFPAAASFARPRLLLSLVDALHCALGAAGLLIGSRQLAEQERAEREIELDAVAREAAGERRKV